MSLTIPEDVIKIANDIKTMKIRGAGRIARAAALALKIAAEKYSGKESVEDFIKYVDNVAKLLLSTRPTAVSLPNAVMYVTSRLKRTKPSSLNEAIALVIRYSNEFIEYSKTATEKIGLIGSRRIQDGDVVLTHCNSSAAVSVIVHAFKQGKSIRVYATETRPKFQGHITAKALISEGVDVTLIPDSAVRYIMKKIDKVIVGADTVAANGAVVNKIGTSNIALAAKEARVRMFVAAETYKFSPATVIGELVEIEERSPLEIVSEEYLRENPNVRVRNPAFDVTPPEYIDAIITEEGLIPPQAAFLVLIEKFGWIIQDYFMKEFKSVRGEYEEWY